MLRQQVRHYSKPVVDVKKYAETLFLPKARLKNRPSPADTKKYIEETGQDLYLWQKTARKDQPLKVFQDGPPYANGELHLGHALNKVLKDIINRYNVMAGYRVQYRPGWDCHGLPIEQAALEKARKKLGSSKTAQLDILEKRRLARELALSMVEKQKESFIGFGVMADWHDDAVYKTLTIDYVIRQLKVFEKMVDKGLITRQDRPVYWSVESGTALAESELEYGDKTSVSVTVKYPLADNHNQWLKDIGNVSLAIWTTTPWTLPSNRSIAVHPDIDYGVFRTEQHGNVVVAIERSTQVLGDSATLVSGPFPGSQLAGLKYRCQLRGEEYPVLSAAYVTSTSGTGLVHNAPGHGKEDYLVCKANGITTYSPIDDQGRYVFTQEDPKALHDLDGMVARVDGQTSVLEKISKLNMVIDQSTITHSVPCDWRSKKPVMVRSTPQFFADVASIKGAALDAIQRVKFTPDSGKTRLEAFTSSRSEWCISRQRAWGVPIPAFFHKHTNAALLNPESVQCVVSRLEELNSEEGLARWFEKQDDISEWLPASLKDKQHEYVKCNEILDVWFDSGTAWTMEPAKNTHNNEPEADYYLEGSDQHRGWFQSSLLTRIAVQDLGAGNSAKVHAPYKKVITHGFVLDEKGQKMSKSLGNVVTPQELITGGKRFKGVGVDGLRLWTAQADYTSDVVLSPTIVDQVGNLLKKLRVTYKFLLGNLETENTAQSEPTNLTPIEQYTLSRLARLNNEVRKDYESFAFNRAVKRLQTHMSAELSALYFDVIKDRMYADGMESPRRQAAQYVLSQVFRVYTAILAPVVPLLTHEVWQAAPKCITNQTDSPFKAGWPEIPEKWTNSGVESDFDVLLTVRKSVQEALEAARSDKLVRSSLGAEVYINFSSNPVLEKYSEQLAELFIVSAVHTNKEVPSNLEWSYAAQSLDGQVQIVIGPPSMAKCPRCWQFTAQTEETLCGRCHSVVGI